MANTIPETIDKKEAMAINQDKLAKERTQLSITRTELAFYNTRNSINQTHLAYLRTIVTLIGTSATIYKALPVLGVSVKFSNLLAFFLFGFAIYFIYKDATVYPKMKRELDEKERQTKDLEASIESEIYDIDVDDLDSEL